MADYKQNPNPQQRYDITLTIADAPGPFASMEGLVQYDVTNQECLPPPSSNPGGYSSHRTLHIPFALTQVSETEYTGTVYADLMLDEDYYGRGVCRWHLNQARVHMKATGADGEALFIPSASSAELAAGKSVTTYFQKVFYPRDPDVDDLPVFGQTVREKIRTVTDDSKLFTVTFIARKGIP